MKKKQTKTMTEVMIEMQASDRLNEIKWLVIRLNTLINPEIQNVIRPAKKNKKSPNI